MQGGVNVGPDVMRGTAAVTSAVLYPRLTLLALRGPIRIRTGATSNRESMSARFRNVRPSSSRKRRQGAVGRSRSRSSTTRLSMWAWPTIKPATSRNSRIEYSLSSAFFSWPLPCKLT